MHWMFLYSMSITLVILNPKIKRDLSLPWSLIKILGIVFCVGAIEREPLAIRKSPVLKFKFINIRLYFQHEFVMSSA